MCRMPIGDYKTIIIYNECLRFLIICRDFLGNTSLCLLCPTKKGKSASLYSFV